MFCYLHTCLINVKVIQFNVVVYIERVFADQRNVVAPRIEI